MQWVGQAQEPLPLALNDIAIYNANHSLIFSSNTSSFLVLYSRQPVRLTLFVGLCCCLACAFGVLYMVVMRANDEYAFLHVGDEESSVNLMDRGGSERGVWALDASRIVFWCFMFVHASLICFWMSGRVLTWEQRQLQMGGRTLSLWILCKTGIIQHKRVVLMSGALLYILSMWRQWSLGVCALDGLLLLGHRWDKHTSCLVVLNCRLCYVACTSLLILLRACYHHYDNDEWYYW
jgi:hypothetical protein